MPTSSSSSTAPSVEPSRLPRGWGLRSLRHLRLTPPSEGAGLLPSDSEGPRPIDPAAMRLRRAVLMFVVFGGMALLAYAMWQRVAHAESASPTAWHQHP